MPIAGKRLNGLLGLALMLQAPATSQALEPPSWLPRYGLDVRLETNQHRAIVRERVTWTNRAACPANQLVFNVHSYFKVPSGDIGFLAKMLEILRLAPSDGMDFEGHACQIHRVSFVSQTTPLTPAGHPGPPPVVPLELPIRYQEKIPTALEVDLPRPVAQGESVTVELEFVMNLPPKQGRWGQWRGVTFLAQWLPVLAVHDDCGWQPVPFIPWHQPFFNEAGVYSGCITLPADQKLACSAPVQSVADLGDGWVKVCLQPNVVRDFALFCSARFHEYIGEACGVRIRCLAFPEHEWYAREMVRIACEAMPIYGKWFGPFPYREFTLVESYFGWNGNECGALVMIDERVFGMPHLAIGFVDNLVSHELCHQWWYNAVGTNGYSETFMDEAMASYFSHRLLDVKVGKNDKLLHYPAGLTWLPNIHRDDYRSYGLYGTLARGEATATVGPMPQFGHLVNLMSMTYDKGSRIVGTIEQRLGEAAFLDFTRRLYARYYFRILRVADFQRELEAYTGTSWEEFFKDWLYGKGLSDWCVEKVKLARGSPAQAPSCGQIPEEKGFLAALHRPAAGPCRATILLRQNAEINEPTILGICLNGGDGFQIRIPIDPGCSRMDLDDPPATVTALPDNRMRVEVTLPCEPTQVMVDPDQVLVDKNPFNNCWKPRVRVRLTPLFTLLDDTDLTNRFDRWNINIGPWIYGSSYNDPWFTRSQMVGLRAGVYRIQDVYGGGYLAYRTDDRAIVAGVDAMWDHFPWSHTQVGFVAERSLTSSSDHGGTYNRGVLYGRYVMKYGSSLYLPPMEYVEAFGAIQEHILPLPDQIIPGADRFDHQTTAGLHYHLDYLTPYWDPEGGFRVDAAYQTGIPIFGEKEPFNQLFGQVSYVKSLPELPGPEVLSPALHWLAQTRLALRAYGAVGLPDKGEFFALGGGEHFRGFDLKTRQGSLVWVGSMEWRVPLARHLDWDCCDHVAKVRNIYAAAFYDAGNAYLRGHQLGDVAHALGGGLRLDVAWFGLIERTTLRFDLAKTVNADCPWQFWFGIQHPF